jgi:hypothetical protein
MESAMKKMSCFLLLPALLLSACQTTPQVAATLPPPTETPIPTPTLYPAFIDLQTHITSQGERFTLSADGTIADGAETVPGVRVSPDGMMTLTLADGTTVMLESGQVSFDDEKGFGIEGYELDENGDWVEVKEIRQFPECSFEDFKSCSVAIEDTQAKQDYVRSLVTPEMFNLDNLKYTKMNVVKLPFGSMMVPDVETAPNYTGANAERTPFIKDNNWNGVTEVDGITHAVVNTPYVVEDGKGGFKVIVMTGFSSMQGGGYDTEDARLFREKMNVIPWRVDQQSIELATRFVNPVTGENFTVAEVTGIIEEMKQGDFTHADGLVLYFVIGKNSGGWFE